MHGERGQLRAADRAAGRRGRAAAGEASCGLCGRRAGQLPWRRLAGSEEAGDEHGGWCGEFGRQGVQGIRGDCEPVKKDKVEREGKGKIGEKRRGYFGYSIFSTCFKQLGVVLPNIFKTALAPLTKPLYQRSRS